MKTVIFNKIISIEYPDDFYEMDKEEISKYFGGDILRFAIRNVEKHVIMSIGKTNKSILNLFATPKSVLSNAENTLKVNLNNYTPLNSFEVEMLSKRGNGMSFKYKANDQNIEQFCEMAIIKYKSEFYITYCLSRFDNVKENEELFRAFRRSLKPINQ